MREKDRELRRRRQRRLERLRKRNKDEVAKRKPALAFQLGAMGSRQHNFYNAAFRRAGFEEEGLYIQRLWLEGRRDEAIAAVPDELARGSSLLGTADMVRDRVRAYRAAGITTLRVDPEGDDLAARIATLGQIVAIVNAVSAEPASVGAV